MAATNASIDNISGHQLASAPAVLLDTGATTNSILKESVLVEEIETAIVPLDTTLVSQVAGPTQSGTNHKEPGK